MSTIGVLTLVRQQLNRLKFAVAVEVKVRIDEALAKKLISLARIFRHTVGNTVSRRGRQSSVHSSAGHPVEFHLGTSKS